MQFARYVILYSYQAKDFLLSEKIMKKQYSNAHSYVGPKKYVEVYILKLSQDFFCQQETACQVCLSCRSIYKKEHYSIYWVSPSSSWYTVADTAFIFDKLTLSLNPDEHFFFIIESADRLTPTVANSLLKVVEEPPQGYHFFFLTEQEKALLSTIASRCHIYRLHKKYEEQLGTFEQFFILRQVSAQGFYSYLAQACPSEVESIAIVDRLLVYWSEYYRNACQKEDKEALELGLAMGTLLKNALAYLPMPGSAKLFWKNLFLQKDALL